MHGNMNVMFSCYMSTQHWLFGCYNACGFCAR